MLLAAPRAGCVGTMARRGLGVAPALVSARKGDGAGDLEVLDSWSSEISPLIGRLTVGYFTMLPARRHSSSKRHFLAQGFLFSSQFVPWPARSPA